MTGEKAAPWWCGPCRRISAIEGSNGYEGKGQNQSMKIWRQKGGHGVDGKAFFFKEVRSEPASKQRGGASGEGEAAGEGEVEGARN